MHLKRSLCLFLAIAWFTVPSVNVHGEGSSGLVRTYPEIPLPERVHKLAWSGSEPLNRQVVRQTLSGLVAYAARQGETRELIWLHTERATPYHVWLERFEARHPQVEMVDAPDELWDLVAHFQRANVVKGYVLYEPDQGRAYGREAPKDASLNVATALCALLGGIAIDPALQAEAEARGLEQLADVRGRNEDWLFENYADQFPTNLLVLQDPRTAVMRDAAVAFGAPIVFNTPGGAFETALKRLEPGSPVFGWGMSHEDTFTGPIGEYAATLIPANWCLNVPLLSAGEMELPDFAFETPEPPRPEPGKRYVAFFLSDGDNLQWAANGFHNADYWASPSRGAIPLGWGAPLMDLAQLYPDTLDYLAETATANDDVLLYGIGGYHYPDTFGAKAGGLEDMAAHASRVDGYLKATGIGSAGVIFKDWNGAGAQNAYRVYAEQMPHLDAIFAVQYAPYAAGQGEMMWYERDEADPLLVISPKYQIWQNHGDSAFGGSPNKVADALNAWAKRPVAGPEDQYAWVIVHAWSKFQPQPLGTPYEAEEVDRSNPDAEQGYLPILWTAEKLSSDIEVVTPSQLVRLIRKQKLSTGTPDAR
ncbi:MAG: hypothetical protein WD294_15395 [Phycisphaeraceae bacterium]